jgi:hypothetical protein
MATLAVDLSAFNNYGISVMRNGFTKFPGAGSLDSSGQVQGGGLLQVLVSDLTRSWQMYNGTPVAGNEIVDTEGNNVTKQFFNLIFPIGGLYSGTPTWGATEDSQPIRQHVLVFESTDEISPKQGAVPRGIDQKFRIRIEYDERQRLYQGDKEFAYELYQHNLVRQNLGLDPYAEGNTVNDSDAGVDVDLHPGYYDYDVTLPANWESTVGIPNRMYAWTKINVGTKNQLLSNGDVTSPTTTSDGLITLDNGMTMNTTVLRDPGELVDISFEDIMLPANTSGVSRSVRLRNKKKGSGWFKRFPKQDESLSGTYPMSYRMTITERGIVMYIYDDAAADQADDYAWFVVQRTVDNTTGIARTDDASRYPTHCMYSCSRESVSARDFGIYFSEQAANAQTTDNELSTVYDENGQSYDVSQLESEGKSLYVLSPFDREDYFASEHLAKKIWRFVAREYDILKPWDVHKSATRHEVDSNAVINPLEQLAITDDNRFVITFPTGLTTQRYMYPKEEIDMICFSSSEVVGESSNIPVQTYKPDGSNVDQRRYQGMRSTMPNGNGMRVLILVNGEHIYKSDVNID